MQEVLANEQFLELSEDFLYLRKVAMFTGVLVNKGGPF